MTEKVIRILLMQEISSYFVLHQDYAEFKFKYLRTNVEQTYDNTTCMYEWCQQKENKILKMILPYHFLKRINLI